VVGTDSSPALVGLDRRESLILVSRKGPDRVRLSWSDPVPGGVLLSRVIAGDVDGDGLVDIVVLDRGSNSAHVMIQGADGHFRQVGRPIDVGFGPSDAILSDLDHDGKLDLVVTSSFSGIVSRFQGRGDGTFGPETRLRAGLDAAGLVSLHGGPARRSDDEPTAVVTGVFDASGLTDLVVVERVADRISILKGTPDGGLADPRLATSYATGRTPTRAVTTRLTRGPWADLAVLNEGSEDVSIFLNDGRGGFIVMPRVDAGDNPTGLLAEDVNKDGIPDLLVSNDSGDLLVLLGRGDGTFAPYQRADRLVSLAAGDLTGDGRAEFVLSDEAGDSLSVRSPDGPDTFQQGRGDGLRAPGPVAISDLDGDGIADLVVINRGGNNVFVYLGLGGGWFAAPRRFHTGTAPEGLTIADINGDKALDLVVSNAGSNDLTILLGQEAGGWDLHPGPRLRVGRQPVSTTIADVDGDGVSDIVCVDQASNDVTILHGVGGGFFDDRKATTLATGLTPIRAFVGRFDASGMGLVILNSRSNDLTFYPDIASGGGRKITIPTGGLNPVAGAMGFYNDDAYEDLVIAHNGDSKISLFHGGPAGLMLFDSIALEGSLRPTDLVLSPTADGLRVYVSTEDRGRVISITFTPGPTSSPAGSAIAEGPASTGISGDPRAWDGSTGATPGAPNSGPNGYGLQADGPQGATSPSSSQAGGTAGASAPGVGVSAIISQAAQALFLQSTTSLNWLIENLVNLGQVQRSEILPLDDNDTAMVAVLLSVSGIATSDDPAVDRAAPDGDDAPSPDGDGAGLPIAPESFVPASTVERYVSGLDRSFADLPRDASVPTSTQVTAGAEWVWSPQDARPAEFKAAESIVSSTQDSMPSADDGEAEASSDEGLEGLDRGLAEPGSSATEMEVPAEFGSATIMIGVIPIILTTVVLSVIHAARRVRAYRESKGLAGLAPPEASTQTRVRRTPGSSKGPAHRHQPNQDSPPWISGRST